MIFPQRYPRTSFLSGKIESCNTDMKHRRKSGSVQQTWLAVQPQHSWDSIESRRDPGFREEKWRKHRHYQVFGLRKRSRQSSQNMIPFCESKEALLRCVASLCWLGAWAFWLSRSHLGLQGDLKYGNHRIKTGKQKPEFPSLMALIMT